MLIPKIKLSRSVIRETEDFLKKQGRKGYEGRVYWIGQQNGSTVEITRPIVPAQVPQKTMFGVSVTVTQDANIKVSRQLQQGEYIVAKIHSHPQKAFISDTDRSNPFLRHEGAISIIVPNFAATGMDNLTNCIVAIFTSGDWSELNSKQKKEIFQLA